jgi:AmmeMemoRadiSam system protein B
MSAISEIRPSPIAGRWYDGDPDRLARQIDGFMDEARLPALDGEVIGLVVPHAGYIYSGRTAAYGFKAVRGQKRDLVIIISPLHGFHPAPALTSAHQAYQTPLGSQRIDAETVRAVDESLRRQFDWGLTSVARDQEHSLEIELPFLQRALDGDFKLLPVMLRTQEPRHIQQLSQVLAEELRGKNCLLVASTDLSHFFPEQIASLLDGEMLRQIGSFSPDGVLEAEREEKGFACGVAAVATVLYTARELGANKVEILHHSTSGDTTGDHTSVVGYGAAAILKK